MQRGRLYIVMWGSLYGTCFVYLDILLLDCRKLLSEIKVYAPTSGEPQCLSQFVSWEAIEMKETIGQCLLKNSVPETGYQFAGKYIDISLGKYIDISLGKYRYFPANWIYSTAVTYKSVTQDTRILEHVSGGLYPKYTLSNSQ